MIINGGGIVASIPVALRWGAELIDWLQRADFLSEPAIQVLKWFLSPLAGTILLMLFVTAFVAALIRTANAPQRATQGAVIQQDGERPLLEERSAVEIQQLQDHIERLRHQNSALQISLTNKITYLESHEWLYEIAERDKREIDKYVVATDPVVFYAGLKADYPYFIITFKVFNYSVHPISIDPLDVKGSIYRNDQELSGNLKMEGEIVNLPRDGSYFEIAVKQWVDPKEAELLLNPLLDIQLRFNKLTIFIKGGDGTSGIEPKRLRLPSFLRIAETQPPNLRVQELKDHIKELEDAKKVATAEQAKPKLEIWFESKPPCSKSVPLGGPSGGFGPQMRQEINVLVRNNSDEPINNLSVEIEEIRIGDRIFHRIPLPQMNDTPPFKREFTLGPRDEMYFSVARKEIYAAEVEFLSAGPELPRGVMEITGGYEYEFEIVARAGNAPPSRGKMRFGPFRNGGLRAGWEPWPPTKQ